MTTDLYIYAPLNGVIWSIRCPYCRAEPGHLCHTAAGKPKAYSHQLRWDSYARMRRNRQMWFVIREDDPRFGLSAGDIVRCINYPYDGKVSVLFREWDGFEPECNQYLEDVAFLGFVPLDMEAA